MKSACLTELGDTFPNSLFSGRAYWTPEPEFVNVYRAQESITQAYVAYSVPVRQPYLSCRPARVTYAGRTDSLESIPGLRKRKIRFLGGQR
jgi:hypothetical protein